MLEARTSNVVHAVARNMRLARLIPSVIRFQPNSTLLAISHTHRSYYQHTYRLAQKSSSTSTSKDQNTTSNVTGTIDPVDPVAETIPGDMEDEATRGGSILTTGNSTPPDDPSDMNNMLGEEGAEDSIEGEDGENGDDAELTPEEELEESRQNLKPSELVAHLDKYIIGQLAAKKSVAVALRNRWRRHKVRPTLRQDITPKNILMVGPTGCGKTEIARRLALITDSPFIKVEATKFTEVGFYGKDVDSIIKDLVRVGIQNLRAKKKAKLVTQVAPKVEEQILLAVARSRVRPPQSTKDTPPSLGAQKPGADWSDQAKRAALSAAKANKTQWAQDQEEYRAGKLDSMLISLPLPRKSSAADPFSAASAAAGFSSEGDEGSGGPGFKLIGLDFLGGGGFKDMDDDTEVKTATVAEARTALLDQQTSSRLRTRDLAKQAIKQVESDGIVFLDEIDKICSSSSKRYSSSGDASAEGVQRDLLPLVEGTTISTPHGPVNTDHILFICSGAFHQVNVGDMLAELQGRLPVRVQLKALTEEDFYHILTVPTNNLIKQQVALLKTDNVELEFTDAALKEIARVACEVNRTVENIGARRLNTVIQRIMDEYSFTASDMPKGTHLTIDVDYVREKIKPLMKNTDLSRFVL